MVQRTIGLVGNPNCGKTTLFNALTGANQRVGNWPGVTVERKEGVYRDRRNPNAAPITVVDLPGVYAIDADEDSTGLDELVARDYLLSGEADLVVNIVDASSLERNLYLTTQLLEMGIPMIVALNMIDLAERREMQIDRAELARRLDCPVIALSASSGEGLANLQGAIAHYLDQPVHSQAYCAYPPVMEEAIADIRLQLEAIAPPSAGPSPGSKRWQALHLLAYDDRLGPHDAPSPQLPPALVRSIVEHRRQIHQVLGEDLDLAIADSRYTWIHHLIQAVVQRTDRLRQTTSDRLDHIVLNRWLGIPIFFAVMYLMFLISINVGGALIDFFDIGIGTLLVGLPTHLLSQINAPGWLIGLLADGVGGGIQTTATFIPQIGLMFIFLALLEDSGYLARAAFVMDRLMRLMGLPGKSFVPMMVSFGCNIPGIMATRTLENRRDRLMTILMNPFMSCGARLPVYALFCAAFFPQNGQNIVFMLYVAGILAAIFTGLVMKRTLFQGEGAPFIMELPPYHVPTVRGVAIRAWERLKSFISKAGKMIVVMVLILGLVNSVGVDGSFGQQDSQDSILSALSRTVTPVFAPMGIEGENWPATVGLFTGVFAKEVMVGTLDSLYTSLAQTAADLPAGSAADFDLWGGLQAALGSIPTNLAALTDQFLDPLGLSILSETRNLEAAAATQEVSYTTFGQMSQRFGSSQAAIAYLLFVLLYFPCVSATAAVYRETNLGWTVFVGAWTTGLAYWVASVYYQSATWQAHPWPSALWIGGAIATLLAVLWGLKQAGDRRRGQRRTTDLRPKSVQ